MKKLFGIMVLILLFVTGGIVWVSLSTKNNIISTQVQTETNQPPVETNATPAFVPLQTQVKAPFIQNIKDASDVKIGFHYDGDYKSESDFGFLEEVFYTPKGSTENFLDVSKVKDRENFAYGSTNYLPIFKSEESHSYQGTPIYIKHSANKYTLSYLGFKMSDRSLISELKIELGIDYNADTWSLAPKENNDFSFSSLLGVKTAEACGPGLYLRKVGETTLTFVQESDGIAWYKLEKPIALYNLSLQYADQDCAHMPISCTNHYDDPQECDKYFSCYYNATITDLQKGNLRMHVYYKPNDKEGLFRLQMVNAIMKDQQNLFYQAKMGEGFDHYYKAYFH